MLEWRGPVARVHAGVARAGDEFDQLLRARLPVAGSPAWLSLARVHQRVELARDEAGVDEHVLLDVERGVAPLEIARDVVAHAVPQREVLCPRRRADRVRLDEPEPIERALQRRGREQTAGDGEAAQSVEIQHDNGSTTRK